jgi:hypothetical protein
MRPDLGYSPKLVEEVFYELRVDGVLRSLPHEKMHIVTMPVGKGAEEEQMHPREW